jgi:hypothetical protein
MSHRLFIFISNRLLREKKYLSFPDDETDVLLIPEGLLSVRKEPAERKPPSDPWEPELKRIIADKIRSYEHWNRSQIRVAGHLMTCFGVLPDIKWRKDRRFPEKEKDLHQELGHEIDLQIWGFHHEPELSGIWTVIREVKAVLGDPREETKAEFFVALEKAFERSAVDFETRSSLEETREIWEVFSLVKHQIVGLFDPDRINLETAREKDAAAARVIRDKVQASLEDKLAKAHKLLDQCEARVTREEGAKWLSHTRDKLNHPPDLLTFGDWLYQLDESLNNLRESVTA